MKETKKRVLQGPGDMRRTASFELGESPSLEVFQRHVDMALRNLV